MSGRLVTEAARARAEEQSLVAKAQAEQLRMEEEEEDALVRRQRALMRYESHMVGCSLQQPHPSRAHAPLKTCCMYVCTQGIHNRGSLGRRSAAREATPSPTPTSGTRSRATSPWASPSSSTVPHRFVALQHYVCTCAC